jgi:simple sugar transport system ATP-binding protein
MMIGGELPHPVHRAPRAGAPALRVDALNLRADDPFGTSLSGVAFEVREGEILGIAGVSGNGQKELLAALSGVRTLARASAITLCGTPVGSLDASARRRLGLAFIPEDRLGRGAVPEMTLADNALLTARGDGNVVRGLVRTSAVVAFTKRVIATFGVKASGPGAIARSLSGGNLQKFIVGREIGQRPKVLIAAQPTWGVDVGAAAQIRQALIDLSERGVAVLVVSEELDELLEICDRLAVIAQGRLSTPKPVRETSAEEIGLLMAAASPREPETVDG